MTLWFITPAWQRFDLSEVCFAQRRHVIDTLAEHGIEARCVVVADDANLDLARAQGFDTVERDNSGLGRKFNDGMEYAGQHGAEWIVPIGSDSWIDPAYFLPLPSNNVARTSQAYCAVTSERLAELRVRTPSGAGPYMLHRSLLHRSNFRPAKDELMSGIDHSTIAGLDRSPDWRHKIIHPFQYIGFRGNPHITTYARLQRKWGVREHDPWAVLANHYPTDLVERARQVMGLVEVAA